MTCAPLVSAHDVLLLDLDGVLYVGPLAVDHAADTLRECRERFGTTMCFVTNNASRTPQAVAGQLTEIGIPAAPAEVITSAQMAAAELARQLPAAAKVLVVGGEGLVVALQEVGLQAVWSVAEEPVAVVQGFHPDVNWRMLAQGAAALHRGVPWVASNRDLTLPTEFGRAPGNGTLIAALETATGRSPVSVGKPEPAAMLGAIQKTGAARPLAIGDRLDTDIQSAHAAGIPSVLVLTGVSTVVDVLTAVPAQRPTWIGRDLRVLLDVPVFATLSREQATAGDWRIGRGPGGPEVLLAGDLAIDGVRALVALAWDTADRGGRIDETWYQLAQRLSSALED